MADNTGGFAPVDTSGFVPLPAAPRKPSPAPVSFIPTSAFRAQLPPDIRDTGDYRTPGRERQLASQGAGTVRPGAVSRHSLGTEDAPGAHDVVPTGDWNANLARLRKTPGVRDAFIEGAQGGQGRHIHVDMADTGGFEAVDTGGFTPASTAPVGGHIQPQAKPATPAPQETNGFQRMVSDVVGPTKAAAHQVMEDIREGPKSKRHNQAGDLLAVPGAAIGGAFNAANRPLAELVAKLPMPGQPESDGFMKTKVGPKPTQEQKVARLQGALGTAEAGLGDTAGEEGIARRLAEKPPVTTEPKLPPPEVHPPGREPVVGPEKDPVERIDNALYRNGGHATAGKLDGLQSLRELPPEVRDPKVQEELTHAIEQRKINPNAPIPEHLQAAYDAWVPWSERQRTALNSIYQRLAKNGMSEDEIKQFAPASDTGYVPRRVVGKSPGLDPGEMKDRDPLAWNQGKRSLAKTTGSMKARDQIVLEDPIEGTRRFEHRNQSNQEWKPGMNVRDPLTGKQMVVKDATIKEIEDAGARDSKGQPITYHKNAIVNTIDEALKAERVDRNLQLLDELTNQMKDQGLAHHDEWHHPMDVQPAENPRAVMGGNAPPEEMQTEKVWVRRTNPNPRPDSFVQLPNIPQLKGWSFDPKIAQVLKDYYPGEKDELWEHLGKFNRFVNASLFALPNIAHAKNVGTMGFIGRGWDWIPTVGNYARLYRTAKTAVNEVMTMGPKYKDFLREGGALQAGDENTRNFYQMMLQAAAKGLEKDPKVAAAGLNPIEIAKAVTKASHQFTWNANDIILFQRYLELMEKGMSKAQAIKEAERWIANYRVPPQIMKSRSVNQLMTNGILLRFGKYDYGKLKALGEMVKGVTQGSASERLDALGKPAMALLAATVIYPAMKAAARFISGNPKADVPMGGEIELFNGLNDEDKNTAEKIGSLVTGDFNPSAAVEFGNEARTNKDVFGRNVIEPNSTPLGMGVQGAEAVSDAYNPAHLAVNAMKPGGWEQSLASLGGLKLPPPRNEGAVHRAQKYDRKKAQKREQRDPFEQAIRKAMQ